MTIKKVCFCDRCEKAIERPTDGFIIKGNIYVADAEGTGGLVGNNFPKNPSIRAFWIDEVKENVFCTKCFLEVLMIKTENKRAKVK